MRGRDQRRHSGGGARCPPRLCGPCACSGADSRRITGEEGRGIDAQES
jgi:hypothetical protein